MSLNALTSIPLVSVLMPAYNAEPFIDETIQSILRQTLVSFELVIVDDCSKDRTFEIAKTYAHMDSRIYVTRNHSNLGIAANRNKAVGLAKGKYIAWQDADDISLPLRLELQSAFLTSNPRVGIVGGTLELFSGNRVLGYRHYPQKDESIRRNIFYYSPITQPAAMIRAEVLHKIGGYDLALPPAEDLDMTFRIGESYQLANLAETLVRYRVSETSATAVTQRRMEINTLKIRFKYAKSSAYQIDFVGVVFNAFHLISLLLIPVGIKRWLFTKLRDVKQ